ncbi:hypothetical protein [Cellulomonas sp. HZM]|uniref:hypothetical protein n=1 Tax=Cellulomonas sp. HZM TaxID=1454010 RepID=UPI0004938896|nr:hypothetical protein [Cellulomonas sp. HZM]
MTSLRTRTIVLGAAGIVLLARLARTASRTDDGWLHVVGVVVLASIGVGITLGVLARRSHAIARAARAASPGLELVAAMADDRLAELVRGHGADRARAGMQVVLAVGEDGVDVWADHREPRALLHLSWDGVTGVHVGQSSFGNGVPLGAVVIEGDECTYAFAPASDAAGTWPFARRARSQALADRFARLAARTVPRA